MNESLRIPPLTDMRALVVASEEVERSEEQNQLPDRNDWDADDKVFFIQRI